MQNRLVRWTMAAALVGFMAAPVVSAEDAAKALPTLLIKGKLVSVKTDDPAAPLVEVEDRYGFKTPIYLSADTKVWKGEQQAASTDLQSGSSVEVEYNFDINTAKRHAVNVKLTEAPAEAVTAAVTTEAPAVVEAPATATPEAPAEPAVDMAAPAATPEQPAASAQ